MKLRTAALLSAAIVAGSLGACSKRADSAADASASASNAASTGADAAAGAAGGATQAGGAVSPPNSPQNDAINTDTNKTETTQTAGSNSFTEDQAKGHIEKAGYTDVTGLTKTPD